MKPGGESEETIQKIHTQARTLQGMGRNGDTVLAHITPAEARLLKARGGAGTTNPATGLLEFYNADKKQGSYIWRTTGDSKVRSSHAGRNGKTFSWDAPPQGGHPGEAYNCRCRAEDVKEKKKDCEKIREEVRAAYRRHDDLSEPIVIAEGKVDASEKKLGVLEAKLSDVESEIKGAIFPGSLSKPSIPGVLATGSYIFLLRQKKAKIKGDIKEEKQTLADAMETVAKLKYEQENNRLNALELSSRYKKCIGQQ